MSSHRCIQPVNVFGFPVSVCYDRYHVSAPQEVPEICGSTLENRQKCTHHIEEIDHLVIFVKEVRKCGA